MKQSLTIFGLLMVVFLTYLFWMRRSSSFPELEQTLYQGKIQGIISGEELSWWLEPRGAGRYLALLARPGQQLEQYTGILRGDGKQSLTLKSNDGDTAFVLVGNTYDDGRISGTLETLPDGNIGHWQLERAEGFSAQMDALSVLSRSLKESFVGKGEGWQSWDQFQKFSQENVRELLAAIRRSGQRQQELAESIEDGARQLEIALSITPRGELIELSRNAMKREISWMEKREVKELLEAPKESGIEKLLERERMRISALEAQLQSAEAGL